MTVFLIIVHDVKLMSLIITALSQGSLGVSCRGDLSVGLELGLVGLGSWVMKENGVDKRSKGNEDKGRRKEICQLIFPSLS